MSNIWIEVLSSSDQSDVPVIDASTYCWQAMFACRVGVQDHQAWLGLKWGMNAASLFEEAAERQKLFLESLHSIDLDTRFERGDARSLALRYINTRSGLQVSLIGKVAGKSKEDAIAFAHEYHHQISSVFPYDYSLIPAASKANFQSSTGWDILNNPRADVLQIKRSESVTPLGAHFPFYQGVWQSGARAYEQIWRSLKAAEEDTILDVLLRPTVLYENEMAFYSGIALDISRIQPDERVQRMFLAYKEWYDNFIKRKLMPWRKFFYLQARLVSLGKVSENLAASIGSALTQTLPGGAPPGYQLVKPHNLQNKESLWGHKIYNMEFTSRGGRLPNQRLSVIADLDEVFTVMRLPYSPPGGDAFDVKFLPAA